LIAAPVPSFRQFLGVQVVDLFGPPSVTKQRSKRPKLQAGSSRGSMGAADKAAMQAELRPCLRLLKDLLRNPLAWPFAKPVDPVAYPDYYTVVTDPIDLGTIQKRLESGECEGRDEFAAEVRRVWSNCFLYNAEGTDVHRMATQLQAIFEQKFSALPTPVDTAAEDQMKQMRKQMKMMQRQMLMMQEMQQSTLSAGMGMNMGVPAAVQPPPSAAKRAGATGGRKARQSSQFPMVSAANQLTQHNHNQDREMTFEEKSSLSSSINKLTSNNLGRVVQIIRTSMPSLGAGSDEIEVDINALDNATLWRLHRFVDSCRASKRRPKKAPTVTASERLQAIQQAQAGAEQHLSEITAGLRSLEGGGDGGGGGGNGSGGGGAGIAFAPMDRDDDSPSDSDSDGGNALGISHAQNGGGGSAFYADFRNSQLQRERERQEAERRQQDAARAAEERARQRAATIERERAAERARHADDNGEIDMLGQSSAMADFESDAMGFGIDPYGNL